ncbi:MAG: molybdopterin molybdotransferase [Gaiellales bacterium]|jgi:molybdopterin molybdotransferase|nr:molybdopterin molybdotransferase [Gaiellales bacterium]
MLSVADALDLIRANSPALAASEQPLAGAVGRVLAKPVMAAVDLPPFATSAMDGYAVRATDLGDGPVPVRFRIAAGDPPLVLEPGTAAGIATGGPVPLGADAIVPIEDAEERDGLVAAPPRSGAFIRPAGGDVAAGQLVAPAGAVLTPAVVAAIAATGIGTVVVVDRPRVAVIATGSELVQPGEALEPGQIYESNGTATAALAARAGAELTGSETVIDDFGETERAFRTAIQSADVVVSSGGVSVGPHDHVKPVLEQLEVREVFWKVAHKPGKPLWFGVAPTGALVFGLPGNPVSSLVCFELFVREALDAMCGMPRRPRPVARLAAPVQRLKNRDHAVRSRLVPTADGMELHPDDAQDSHLIVHAAAADAAALVAAGDGVAEAGEVVEYLPL